MTGAKTYFISDIHLGLPNNEKSFERELLLIKLLDILKKDAKTIYFVGDIFDFWWEYKYVVPRGYVRFLGKIAELSDSGIKIHFFTGNHDVWMKSYLSDELGLTIHEKEFAIDISGKKFFIAHGDGLGKGDNGYKFLKRVFTNKFLQWCYSRLHPNFAFSLAKIWSQSRRKKETHYEFKGEDKELLIKFSKDKLKTEHFDYFIFGHRHFPVIIDIGKKSKYVNIGDWLVNFTFVEFDGISLQQFTFRSGEIKKFATDITAKQKVDIF
ncbi:MAG: UDP-2,3-diacylglucosamine diphosphatase [Bacteroidales bacterium]|nr:UDP-2,3-diacylglucosamine diphosphatase [Bacteroidales bacterium]